MTTAVATHIFLDSEGRPWVEGTNTKVVEVILDWVAWGWGPEQIHRQHPHLPLSKIYAAFSYYYDHQADFDAEIERQRQQDQSLKAQAENSPLRQRLRAAGKLP